MFTKPHVISSLVVCIKTLRALVFAAAALASWSPGTAADWPMLGRTAARNAVSPESGAPLDWDPGEFDGDTGEWLRETARNVKWVGKLGTLTYGDPVVANGLVWVGTNNYSFSTDRQEDASVLMCFRESDGELLYKYVSPRLPQGRQIDWPFSSLASSPFIQGDCMWFTTNRGEVVCIDFGRLLLTRDLPKRPLRDGVWKVWTIDMIKDFGVAFRGTPMGASHFSSPVGYKDWIYVVTGHGIPYDAKEVPAPDAPSLLCIDKRTGKIVWSDNSPGANILDGQWVSPLVMEIGGRAQCIAPQGDGWVRSFDAESGELLWEFDMNAKESIWSISDKSTRNSILATPVYYDGYVYLASGRHPEFYQGPGRQVCIDPTKTGDISSELAVDAQGNRLAHRRLQAVDAAKGERAIANPNSGLVWEFTRQVVGEDEDEFLAEMHRSVTPIAADDGLVIAVDFSGAVHCLDAKTGQRHWSYDLLAECIAAPLIVDGKIYVGDGDGEVAVFRLSPDPNVAMRRVGNERLPIAEIYMGTSVLCSPIFANGILYLATGSHLFAIQETDPKEEQRDDDTATAMGEWKEWRGPGRANKSPETGLLKEWPEGGPPLVWTVEGLGHSIASVSIEAGRIYTTTYANDAEYVVALDQATGRLAWATHVGASVGENSLMRLLSQRTPTLDGERLYALTAGGDLVCLRTADGQELWRKNYVDDFQGQPGNWHYCDFPLVDGDKLICTPHGRENTMVALDKLTGETIWTSSVVPDEQVRPSATYAATVAIEAGGTRQYVNFLQGRLTGIAANDGALLWQYDGLVEPRFDPQLSLTPIVQDDQLFCVGGRGAEIALLQVTRTDQGPAVRELFRREARINHFQDNLIAVDGHVFASHRSGGLMCIAMQSGDTVWGNEEQNSRGVAGFLALTHADGRLYVRHADGTVVLVEASPQEYVERGRLRLREPRTGMGATAPVIAGGRLYVRDDDRLYCYDIRQEAIEADRPEPRTVTIGFAPRPPMTRGFDLRGGRRGSRSGDRPGPRSVFVPTPQDVVERMLELAEVKEDDLVYDLGSGDGRIVITAAKEYGSRAVGVEIDAELVGVSRAKAAEAGVGELVTIEQKDIFESDLSEADVVAVYLLPTQLEKLIGQLEKLPAGARIVSHQFEIPGIQADRTERVTSDEDGAEHTIHLWTAPLKR